MVRSRVVHNWIVFSCIIRSESFSKNFEDLFILYSFIFFEVEKVQFGDFFESLNPSVIRK